MGLKGSDPAYLHVMSYDNIDDVKSAYQYLCYHILIDLHACPECMGEVVGGPLRRLDERYECKNCSLEWDRFGRVVWKEKENAFRLEERDR